MNRKLNKKYYGTYKNLENEFYIGEEKIQFSFLLYGIMHITPFNIEYQEDSVKFCINDETYRMVYELKFFDEFLDYTVTQFGNTDEYRAKRVGKEAEFCETHNNKPLTYDLLAEYQFDDQKYQKIDYQYDLYNTNSREFFKTLFNIEEVDNINSDSKKAIWMLNQISTLIKHNGGSGLPNDRTVKALHEFSKNFSNAINCRGLAIILSEALRCVGLKAYHVTCLPYNTKDRDCHVVTEVYCDDLSKWIMIDPSFNAYVMVDNQILNLAEFREALEKDYEIIASSSINHNGDQYTIDDYKNYMAKNTFRLKRNIKLSDGLDHSGENCTYLVPKKYEFEDNNKQLTKITNIKYFYS